MELEEELRVVANNLKSLEVEHEHNSRVILNLQPIYGQAVIFLT